MKNIVNLFKFVTRARTLYRQGKLSMKRVHELEAIPGWTWR